jgi:hypothetical protein
MAVAQEPHGPQHVRVALARHEVGEGHERRVLALARQLGRQVGAEVDHARAAGPGAPGALRRALRVAQHEPRRREGTRDVRRLQGVVEPVAAVGRDDERSPRPRPAHGVPRRDGVVRVHEVEPEAPAQAAQVDPERGSGPGAPRPVVAGARRRRERHVVDVEPVEHPAARMAQQRERRAGQLAPRRAQRGDRPVQDDDVHLRPGVPGGERLPVGPDAEDRVVLARVVLRDDADLHRTPSRGT